MPVTVSSRRDRRARTRGQSLVELAIIAPVFLLLLLSAIDLGRLMYSQITITNAAKEGALVASQGGTFQSNQPCSDTNTVMCGVLTEAKGGFVEVEQTRVGLSPATCDPNAMYPSSGVPPTVTVTVSSPFRVVTPIIGSIVGNNLVLGAEAEAQCLVVPAVTFPSIPAPTAAFIANPMSGPAPLDVDFDASSSSSPGATIASYSWSFGGTGVMASNSYPAAGSYAVTLTVTDSRGATDTETQVITVTGGGPPPACPTVTFTATDSSNRTHPHRMDLEGSVSDSSNGWTWVWSGAATGTGQRLNNYDFATGGLQSVTLTATKAACLITTTQTVAVP
jgi:PKD repeat protein